MFAAELGRTEIAQLLVAAGADVETVLYLKTPPTKADLERIIGKLDDPVGDLVRKDNRFKELGLNADDYTSKTAVVALLLEHPELMQRPIIESSSRAAIGRPPEDVVASFLG